MKVVHVPYCFRPDPVGGTEVYVEALAREQLRRGLEVVVAAPAQTAANYLLDGLSVHRFGTMGKTSLNTLYGGSDCQASREFAYLLDRERPDLVHLHAFTSVVSGGLAEQVRLRSVGLVFTYHTPTVSCQRGTLLRWGREVCDGKLDVRTCAACTLHARGAMRPISVLVGALPTRVGAAVGSLGLTGGAWTGLRMTDLVLRQQAALRGFMHRMDHLVVLCRWAGDVLARNGIPSHKVTLSRHGLPHQRPRDAAASAHRQRAPGTLRVAFLGRLDPTKGADVLVRAVRSLPDVALELHLFGVVQNRAAIGYERSLRALAANDPRIQFCGPVESDDVPALLANYDVVAVPSRWLETGPLVVLEAFAAGVPVLGSRLGGVAELVHDGVDGILVSPDSVPAWSAALRQLWQDQRLVEQLRAGVRPPRGMAAVADDMLMVYERVLHTSRT